MKSLKEYKQLVEGAPPDDDIKRWIEDNKDNYYERYGREKGHAELYAAAWDRYNQKIRPQTKVNEAEEVDLNSKEVPTEIRIRVKKFQQILKIKNNKLSLWHGIHGYIVRFFDVGGLSSPTFRFTKQQLNELTRVSGFRWIENYDDGSIGIGF